MARRKLPRANGTTPVVPSAAVWNALADYTEQSGRLFFAPPLFAQDTVTGTVVSVVIPRRVCFKVKDIATHPGAYQVSMFTGGPTGGPFDPSGTGNLTIADFGSDPDTFNAYAINAQELSQPGHDIKLDGTLLPNPPIYFGWIINYATDGKPVIGFDSSQFKNCS